MHSSLWMAMIGDLDIEFELIELEARGCGCKWHFGRGSFLLFGPFGDPDSGHGVRPRPRPQKIAVSQRT